MSSNLTFACFMLSSQLPRLKSLFHGPLEILYSVMDLEFSNSSSISLTMLFTNCKEFLIKRILKKNLTFTLNI